MELSPEAYFMIVAFVGNRNDLCSLCRVSKGFQVAAERALYNTLQMSDPRETVALCDLLHRQRRLALLVVALTVSVQGPGAHSEDEGSASQDETQPFPPNYWHSVARALRHTTRLRFLNIYLDSGADPKQAWILDRCSFQLHAFHCDLAWDSALVSFLATQSTLSDLYVADFNEDTQETVSISNDSLRQAHILPKLTIIECTFTEAVGLLVPGRPVTRVKTCFSRPDLPAKREEMASLLDGLRSSSRSIGALNVADSVYTESFSIEFLSQLVIALNPDSALRYFGPLVLPVDGRQRLILYSQLRRLPQVQCTELEVSAWDPPPVTFAAMRALASELRLYCPSITTVIFSRDFEPSIVRAVNGLWQVDHEMIADSIWREI